MESLTFSTKKFSPVGYQEKRTGKTQNKEPQKQNKTSDFTDLLSIKQRFYSKSTQIEKH